jgi:hypothetical protein
MLALSDHALALLLAAGAKVSYKKRSRWLKEVAGKLEAETPVQAFRRRQRSGLAIFRTIHDVGALEDMLRDAGHLGAFDDDHAAIQAALQAYLDLQVGEYLDRD